MALIGHLTWSSTLIGGGCDGWTIMYYVAHSMIRRSPQIKQNLLSSFLPVNLQLSEKVGDTEEFFSSDKVIYFNIFST